MSKFNGQLIIEEGRVSFRGELLPPVIANGFVDPRIPFAEGKVTLRFGEKFEPGAYQLVSGFLNEKEVQLRYIHREPHIPGSRDAFIEGPLQRGYKETQFHFGELLVHPIID